DLTSAPATVSITVNNVNDNPVAEAQQVITPESTPIDITLVATDIETAPVNLTYLVVTQPAHGTVTLVGNVATYTPEQDYNGADSFSFQALDDGDPAGSHAHPGNLASVPADVDITITAVNFDPAITSAPVEQAIEDVLYSYQVTAQDADPEDVLAYSLIQAPSQLGIDAGTGLITGTFINCTAGTYPIQVQVSDGNGGTDNQQFTLVVVNVPGVFFAPLPEAVEQVFLGQAFSFDFTSTDEGQGNTAYSITEGPAWLSIDPATGALSGVAAELGSSQVTVSVNDAHDGIDTHAFTINVVEDETVVAYTLVLTDANGLELATDAQGNYVASRGATIRVVVSATDRRDVGAAGGVSSAFADLVYDLDLMDWTAGSLVWGDTFPSSRDGVIDEVGQLVDEAGGVGDATPTGATVAQRLFSLSGVVHADATVGSVIAIALNEADNLPAHQTRVYGEVDPVITSYASANLVVGGSWQNPDEPVQDVNDSGTVEPQDALIIVNKLNAEGAHLLQLPQDADPVPGVGMYWDVNGDVWVSPIDALLVINYLNASPAMAAPGEGLVGQGPGVEARVRLEATDLDGAPLATAFLGQTIFVSAYVQDLRVDPQGVFAAYFDMGYTDVVSLNGAITYDADYPNGHSGDVATPGLIDEAGAFSGITPLGGDEQLLFTVPFVA
ncbi:putative Ig domain-containing protein, partial [bacterium]|nr:putative Ig domain-containing protein [bacterium]